LEDKLQKLSFQTISGVYFLKLDYSRSLRFGFRDGSLERNPKMNNETKKIIVA